MDKWFFKEDFFERPFINYVDIRKKCFYDFLIPDYYYYSILNDFKCVNYDFDKLNKLYNANKAKFKRCRDRIDLIMDNCPYVYFCTFTFNDVYVDKYKLCFRYFKENFLSKYLYVANIDRGSINERVHYHCVLGSLIPLAINTICWKYGFFNIKLCDRNSKGLANYITKLSYHSFKETNKLIYSRLFKNFN